MFLIAGLVVGSRALCCLEVSAANPALCQLLFEAASQQLTAGIGSRTANLLVTFDNALTVYSESVLCCVDSRGGWFTG